jgi:hypothetical protein
MRMIFRLALFLGFCYAFYAGAMSAWQYFQVAGTVDEAFEQRNIGQSFDLQQIRDHVLRVANEAGVPLSEREVSVQLRGDQVIVEVIWSFPVVVFKGEVVLAVPLSVKRQRTQGELKPTPYR